VRGCLDGAGEPDNFYDGARNAGLLWNVCHDYGSVD
jgi:hypothetical protein